MQLVQRFLFGGVMILLVAFGLAGCSSFERAWQKAGQTDEGSRSALAGRWKGTWRSEANGHNGQLRAIVTPATNDVYSARFHAKYKLWFIRFTYSHSVLLRTQRTNDTFRFEGEANLGWLAGGVYHYAGSSGVTNFTSTYCSKYDHGVFEMGRPASGD